MLGVAHLEDELTDRNPVTTGGLAARQDVDPVVGQDLSNVREQVGPVQGLHLNLDHESALFARPGDLYDAFGLLLAQFQKILAVGPMNRDALVAGDEPGDGVPWHWSTATGQLDPDIVHALDRDPLGGLRPAGLATRCRGMASCSTSSSRADRPAS